MAPVTVRYIVDDVDAAIAFYTQRLGFGVELRPAPGFAIVSRGDLRLLLNAPIGPGGAAQPSVRTISVVMAMTPAIAATWTVTRRKRRASSALMRTGRQSSAAKSCGRNVTAHTVFQYAFQRPSRRRWSQGTRA